jgi:hypothetical protein
MFSSRLNAFHSTHLRSSLLCPPRPPLCHPERSEGAAFFYPFLITPNSHASQALLRFYTTTLLRAQSNTCNPNPLMRLLHDPLDTPGRGSFPTTWPSFAQSHNRFYFRSNCPAPILEQPPTAIPFKIRTYTKRTRIPFGIRTSETQDLKSFRIRTYKKTEEGAPGSVRISALSTSRLSVAHSMLRPAP